MVTDSAASDRGRVGGHQNGYARMSTCTAHQEHPFQADGMDAGCRPARDMVVSRSGPGHILEVTTTKAVLIRRKKQFPIKYMISSTICIWYHFR